MTRRDQFVGRQHELDELRDHWRRARAGRGGFVLVTGEAGIGKTRLVEQFAEEVGQDGAVAWGATGGPDAPALWLWRSVLRDVQGPSEHDTRGSEPVPGPRSDLGDPAGPAEHERVRLVDALVNAARQPLLVVLDDLHWADADSVGLLRLTVGEARRVSLLVVGTARSEEIDAGSLLHATLADLAPSAAAIHLDGLSADGLHDLVHALTGRSPSEDLVSSVIDRTGGNPFFVREVLRLLVAEGGLDDAMAGGDLGVPTLVRDVLLRRVGQLSGPARAVLDTAAVTGTTAVLDLVAAVTNLPTSAVVDAAAEAEAARLVAIEAGRLRFTHDLVRDALTAALEPRERRRLHLAVAHATRDRPGTPASEIAHHLLDALPSGDPAEAAEAAQAAGRDALADHAPGEAVRFLERALGVVVQGGATAPADLLLALGDARSARGDRPGAREAYWSAADSARAAASPEGLAHSALGFAGVMGTPAADPDRVELLEEALAALEDRRDGLVARVMARLAHALLFTDQRARRLQLAGDAVALARSIGDDGALASALYVWNIVHITSTNHAERRAHAEEMLALGRASRVPEVEAWALHVHAHVVAEDGDFAGFDGDVAACVAIARRTHSATWQWASLVHRAMRATMQGRFAAAEDLGERAFESGSRSQHDLAAATYGAHLVALRMWQGRLDELLPVISAGAARFPELPAAWASVPFAQAELGRVPEAVESLRRISTDRVLEDLPGSQSWTVALAMLARAASVTGDEDLAARLLVLLDPIGDRHIIGPFADCYFGPASLYVGLCAMATGDDEAAVEALERAERQAIAVGARPVLAWVRSELKELLVRIGGEAGRVAQLRDAVDAELVALGMVRRPLAAGQISAEPVDAPVRSATPNAFVPTATGGWSITFDGQTVEVRATKGLTDLHRLVSAPGEELHVLELAREADGDGLGPAARTPILDEQAKAAYRRRVVELQAEVDDARDCADLGRLERAEVELDAVVTELTSGFGLGGRDRAAANEAERARQAVRARIRYALDLLGRTHPSLRRHLQRSVVTGTFCAYEPERPMEWTTW